MSVLHRKAPLTLTIMMNLAISYHIIILIKMDKWRKSNNYYCFYHSMFHDDEVRVEFNKELSNHRKIIYYNYNVKK